MTAVLFAVLTQAVDFEALRQRADALLEEAKAAYEQARSTSSVPAFVDAGFKLEEARIKYLVLQEIGTPEVQKLAGDRLRAVNQLTKLINDGRVAVMNPPAPAPADPAAPAVPAPPPLAGPAVDVTKRAAVPDASKQKDAEKQVKEIFKDQYAKKAPADRQALTRTLLDQASKSADDPAAAWVLYREAQDVAVQACQVAWVVAAVDATSRAFDVDGLALKTNALTAASKTAKTPTEFGALANALLVLIDDLMAADQYEAADKAAAAALQHARRGNDPLQIKRTTTRAKDVGEAKTKFQGLKKTLETLAQKPDDGAANNDVGQFHCFVKGNWELGLRFLAKSSDAELRKLAEREVASGDSLEAADGWWDFAQKEKSPLKKSQMLQHARAVYERLLPNAPGLDRIKIEKRLAEGVEVQPNTVAAGLVAWWRFEEKAGTSAADGSGKDAGLTTSNGAAWGEGRLGGGLVLDGNGARATATDTTFMNIDREAFSVACFVKLGGTAPYRVVNKWDLSPPARGWLLDVNTGQSVGGQAPSAAAGNLRARISDGRVGVDYVVGVGLVPGAWRHIAFTADFKGDGLKVYLDGAQVGKTQNLGGITGSLQGTAPLSVGWMPGPTPTPNYFQGNIDDLRLYKRALSAAEVRELAGRK